MRRVLEDTEEHRDGVLGQLGPQILHQRLVVKRALGLGAEVQSGAAGATFMIRDQYAVDIGFLDARETAECFGDFGGCAGFISTVG